MITKLNYDEIGLVVGGSWQGIGYEARAAILNAVCVSSSLATLMLGITHANRNTILKTSLVAGLTELVVVEGLTRLVSGVVSFSESLKS